MFAGETTPEAVLEAAYKSGGQKNLEPLQKLYGQLYVALYYEARGDKEKRREHLQKAVDLNLQTEYMWEVARVHLELLNKGRLK